MPLATDHSPPPCTLETGFYCHGLEDPCSICGSHVAQALWGLPPHMFPLCRICLHHYSASIGIVRMPEFPVI
jgi:hypothetical protein